MWKRLLTFTSLLKDIVKDTDEQPDEEMHRARSGRVLSAGASVPLELGCVTLPVWLCSPTWKLSEPHTSGILPTEASARGHDGSLTPLPAPFPSRETRRVA